MHHTAMVRVVDRIADRDSERSCRSSRVETTQFKNGGPEWQRDGEPELVDVHDFPHQAIGKAIPYGVSSARTTATRSTWRMLFAWLRDRIAS